MSTPSTATATLPPNPHYGYSHHQHYQNPPSAYRSSNTALAGGSRQVGNYAPTSASHHTSNVGSTSLSQSATSQPHHSNLIQDKERTMSYSQSVTSGSGSNSKKRNRSREPDWHNFYKNGLPAEVIVIDDTPPPQSPIDGPSNSKAKGAAGRIVAGSSQKHTAKKRKRDEAAPAYDPVYHLAQTPSPTNTPYKNSNSDSTSTDRTTSAIQTTAATSLGSQYSQNGHKVEAEVQSGQKRKRVATRQQMAKEAKRREVEVNGDASTNYKPPPRPPVKAAEVIVKALPDVSIYVESRDILLICLRTHTQRTAKLMMMMATT